MTKILEAINNLDITEYAKTHNLPLINIIMRDETDKITKEGFYILNLDTTKGEGTHWTSLYYHPLNSYYFDSYGVVPPYKVELKIKPYIYNEKDIQDFDSEACGWFALAFIKFLNDKNNKKKAFEEFLKLFSNNTEENDKKLKKYMNII